MDNEGIIKVKGQIVSVMASGEDGIYSDTILIKFIHDNVPYIKPFDSPPYNEENLRMWRKTILSVFAGKGVKEHPGIQSFSAYKKELMGKEPIVAFDGFEIIGIGIKDDNLFYPDAYGLWGLAIMKVFTFCSFTGLLYNEQAVNASELRLPH